MPRDFKFVYALENSNTHVDFFIKSIRNSFAFWKIKFLLQFYEVAALFVNLSMINSGPWDFS